LGPAHFPFPGRPTFSRHGPHAPLSSKRGPPDWVPHSSPARAHLRCARPLPATRTPPLAPPPGTRPPRPDPPRPSILIAGPVPRPFLFFLPPPLTPLFLSIDAREPSLPPPYYAEPATHARTTPSSSHMKPFVHSGSPNNSSRARIRAATAAELPPPVSPIHRLLLCLPLGV
jgi:hypothetical protein